MTPSVSRSFILGLDGVPWNLISDWVEQGELPNFDKIFDSGATGPLKSTTPPLTALAWPSIATGVRPDKHGIYSFRKVTKEHTQQVYTSNEWKQPPIWDILSKGVVGNVPMTYPAQELNGKMVSGMMTPEFNQDAVFPSKIYDEIKEFVPEYKIGLEWNNFHNRKEEFLEEIDSLIDTRKRLLRYLMKDEEWEIFFFVFTTPDRLQHLIWDEDILLDYYKIFDEIVGEIIEYTESMGSNLFIVSDHGFGPVSKTIYLNEILRRNQILYDKSTHTGRNLMNRLGISKSNISYILDRIGLKDRLKSSLPQLVTVGFQNKLPGKNELYDVDFSRTSAFAHGKGNIYINDIDRFQDGIVPTKERENVKTDVKNLFQSYTPPEVNTPVLDVYDGDKLFSKDTDSPDLVVVPREGFEIKTSLSDRVIKDTSGLEGGHRPDGIFLALGPNISQKSICGAKVYDIVPTLLHSQLNPVPQNTDGEILDIFERNSSPNNNSPDFERYKKQDGVQRSDDFDRVENRLKGLGYME